jgi:hypothetical protein
MLTADMVKVIRTQIPRAAALAALALAACHQPSPPAATNHTAQTEPGYSPPPRLTAARRGPGGGVQVMGLAPPGVRVRLASPTGAAIFATSDGAGVWKAGLPPAPGLRLFGLSAPIDGRAMQAEGYFAITPQGQGAMLRSGAGALVIDGEAGRLAIRAIDYDRKGATVVSGFAPPDARLTIQADGVAVAIAQADSGGRFAASLARPLPNGPHTLAIVSAVGEAKARLDVGPAARPTTGPFAAAPAPDGGWRIDWLTPGGGVQTTVLTRSAP